MKASVFVPIKNGVVILDIEDYLNLKGKIYNSSSSGYARTTHKRGTDSALLHRHILNYPNSIIDHVNQNKLDNRKVNLRLSSKSLNALNTKPKSGNFRGVCKDGRTGKFRAYATINLQRMDLGLYESEIEAAEIVNLYIIKKLGYNYYLNNVGNDYGFFTPIPNRYYPRFIEISHINKKRKRFFVRFEINKKAYKSNTYERVEDAIMYRNNIYCLLCFLHCR